MKRMRILCTKCGSTTERPKDPIEAKEWGKQIKDWVELHKCRPPDEPR